MDMDKKDLKRLSKLQHIKLLLIQEAKKPCNSINEPIPPPGKLESIKPKPVPQKGINEDIILLPPKPTRKRQPPTPKDDFNLNNDIFQTENQSLEKFEMISAQSRENKNFRSYTNEFKVKILRKLDNVKEIYITYSKK